MLSHSNHLFYGRMFQISCNCWSRTQALPYSLHGHHDHLHPQVHHNLPLLHHRDCQECSIFFLDCDSLSAYLDMALLEEMCVLLLGWLVPVLAHNHSQTAMACRLTRRNTCFLFWSSHCSLTSNQPHTWSKRWSWLDIHIFYRHLLEKLFNIRTQFLYYLKDMLS